MGKEGAPKQFGTVNPLCAESWLSLRFHLHPSVISVLYRRIRVMISVKKCFMGTKTYTACFQRVKFPMPFGDWEWKGR